MRALETAKTDTMAPLHVMTVFGTRPEAIKLAPVIKTLQSDKRFRSTVVVTAQHREMLDQVLHLFNIKPDVDLDLMRENQDLASLTASIFTHIDPVLASHQPDWLLVQGDTTTVMAAALNAFYRQIRVGHVEAGLRTKDKWQPFPEEINRRIASAVADLHFAPTHTARDNLLREGIPDKRIKVTGNTIIDALNQASALAAPENIKNILSEKGIASGDKRLVLVTAHRRENFGQPIREICEAIKILAEMYGNSVEFIYPVHLNPHIKEPVNTILGGTPNVTLLPPIPYLALVHLLKNAYIILTDSGGIQEEATGLGVPCLVLRDVTERPEGIDAGVLKLVGAEQQSIIREAQALLEDATLRNQMANAANPYGDGTAAQQIISYLLEQVNS